MAALLRMVWVVKAELQRAGEWEVWTGNKASRDPSRELGPEEGNERGRQLVVWEVGEGVTQERLKPVVFEFCLRFH